VAPTATPPEVRANQLAATVPNYRRQAIADGIPFRLVHPLFNSASNGEPARHSSLMLDKSAPALQAVAYQHNSVMQAILNVHV